MQGHGLDLKAKFCGLGLEEHGFGLVYQGLS